MSYDIEKKPIKPITSAPQDIDFMSELSLGRFSLMCNVNHNGKISTAKIYDKSDPEGEDAAKRDLKNLKSIRHQRIVSTHPT